MSDDHQRAAYLKFLHGQDVTLDIEHEGKTYTVTYRPEKVVTAPSKYGDDPPAHQAVRLFREVIADIRVDGQYAGRVDRLATTSPALMEVLVTAVGQHFIGWNAPVVARFFAEGPHHE